MKNKTNIFLLGALLLSCVALESCSKPNLKGDPVNYTFTLQSINGKSRLTNVEVKLYAGKHLITSGFTGANGVAEISAVPYNYTVKFDNLADHYLKDTKFTTSKDDEDYSYVYKIPSTVRNEEMPIDKIYRDYDVVYDFDVTDSEGNSFSFYDEFQKYDMFFINFFYVDCYWCQQEFPVLKKAIEGYENKVGMILIDINYNDTNEYINRLKTAFDIPFKMAREGNSGLSTAFNVTGTPCSVIVDKYGIYAQRIEGYHADTDFFTELFIKYTMPTYNP